jgi:hypothetical protein
MLIKILNWLRANGATVCGVIQGVIKTIKEILTGIVNLLSLVMTQEQAEILVAKIRDILNIVDNVVEKLKDLLLKYLS